MDIRLKKTIFTLLTAVFLFVVVFAFYKFKIFEKKYFTEKDYVYVAENFVDMDLSYIDKFGDQRKKILTKESLKNFLKYPEKQSLNFEINKILLNKEFSDVYLAINIPAQNEIFEIDESTTTDFKKVLVFQTEKNGEQVDLGELQNFLEKSLSAIYYYDTKTFTHQLRKKVLLPTQEKNKYGIRELLGSGYSSFAHSDYARDYNIRQALEKIDGVLVAPGEDFSLLSALVPFVKENGYLDGLVIKGKEISPEIGGGMCQVSSTLFRAAMNSGLKIRERQNHSLWISWYNDIRNGQPGTDATIYENKYGSDIDFKFQNNTDAYIMIRIRVTKTGELNIDLYGTNDGRAGSYSEPEVLEIFDAPIEVIDIPSSLVATGTRKCSGPFKGAKTTFTYTVKTKNGLTRTADFNSFYRPQAKSCLVNEK